MKIVGLNPNSNLVFVMKISAQSKICEALACILVQGDLILDYICNIKYGAFFTIARPFFNTRKKIHDFLVLLKLNKFIVESFLIGIGLVIGFQLQSAITKILESFLNTNLL